MVRRGLRYERLNKLYQWRREGDDKYGYSVINSEPEKKVGDKLSFNHKRAMHAEATLIKGRMRKLIRNRIIKVLSALSTIK